jgi:hypothetical protein
MLAASSIFTDFWWCFRFCTSNRDVSQNMKRSKSSKGRKRRCSRRNSPNPTTKLIWLPLFVISAIRKKSKRLSTSTTLLYCNFHGRDILDLTQPRWKLEPALLRCAHSLLYIIMVSQADPKKHLMEHGYKNPFRQILCLLERVFRITLRVCGPRDFSNGLSSA